MSRAKPKADAESVPPYSVEAEMSALGSVFYAHRECHAAVFDGLNADDWFLPAHRTLWQVLGALYRDGAPLDLVTAEHALVKAGKLDEIGGQDYLIRVAEFVPGPSSGPYYAAIVAQEAALRRYEQLARDIMTTVRDPGTDFAAKRLAIDEAYLAASNGHLDKTYDLEAFTNVDSRPIPWLYKPYLALGTGALLAANPGVGKSCFTYAFAAAVTRGSGPPGFHLDQPGDVLLCSSEDDAHFVQRPRLDEAGADCSRIFRVPGLVPPMTVEKMRIVVSTVQTMANPLLAIFDPIVEWFPAKTNMNAQNEARAINVLFRDLARQCTICVLLVGHANKKTDAELIMRAIGSIDFTAFVRSYLFATRVADTGETAIIHAKTNLRSKGKAIGYQVDEDDKLYWTGLLDIGENEVMAPQERDPVTPKQLDRCKAWIEQQLRAESLTALEVFQGARSEGYSAKTVKRAKAALPIRSSAIREHGKVVAWNWSWQSDERPQYWQDKDEEPDVFAEP